MASLKIEKKHYAMKAIMGYNSVMRNLLLVYIVFNCSLLAMSPFAYDKKLKNESDTHYSSTVLDDANNQKPSHYGIDISDIVEKSLPSVVSIKVLKYDSRLNGNTIDLSDLLKMFERHEDRAMKGFQSQPIRESLILGSGFVCKSSKEEAFIMTNAHLVMNANKIMVQTNIENGKTISDEKYSYTAEVVGVDERTDLAIIKIKTKSKIPALRLAKNISHLKIGQGVFAIGNPFGLNQTVSYGIISSMARDLAGTSEFGREITDFIQTDASMNMGNSGGPLINMQGEVVGISNAILSSQNSGNFLGIGFAIPSPTASFVMEQLLNAGEVKRGGIGVVVSPLIPSVKEKLKIKNGVLVSKVANNSPSRKAGIKMGDIISKVNGKDVVDVDYLTQMIKRSKIGAQILLQVIRNGKTEDITVDVVNLDNAHGVGTRVFNMMVEDITDNHISDLKLEDPYNKGILIKEIIEVVKGRDSAMKKLNLQAGDIIYKIGDKKENANVAYLNKIYNKIKQENKTNIMLHIYKHDIKAVMVMILKQEN